jgi:hypothetical protein
MWGGKRKGDKRLKGMKMVLLNAIILSQRLTNLFCALFAQNT